MPPTRVLAIVGPTATGKTSLGVALALMLGGEVVSADSRQVYRGLDLGTGKVTRGEAQGVPHHLIDIADPVAQFTVHDFVRLARTSISEIARRGKLPIVVGGTGLYVDTLLGRLELNAPPPDPKVRSELRVESLEKLQDRLKERDPKAYTRVDLKNRRRVERALEIALSPSQTLNSKLVTLNYSVTWIGLTLPREKLRARIKARLEERLATGMLKEAERLHAGGLSYERMDGLGLEYRYLARHLQGLMSYEEMCTTLEQEIYKYAKRQMTWFKRNTDIHWLDADSPTLLEQALVVFA